MFWLAFLIFTVLATVVGGIVTAFLALRRTGSDLWNASFVGGLTCLNACQLALYGQQAVDGVNTCSNFNTTVTSLGVPSVLTFLMLVSALSAKRRPCWTYYVLIGLVSYYSYSHFGVNSCSTCGAPVDEVSSYDGDCNNYGVLSLGATSMPIALLLSLYALIVRARQSTQNWLDWFKSHAIPMSVIGCASFVSSYTPAGLLSVSLFLSADYVTRDDSGAGAATYVDVPSAESDYVVEEAAAPVAVAAAAPEVTAYGNASANFGYAGPASALLGDSGLFGGISKVGNAVWSAVSSPAETIARGLGKKKSRGLRSKAQPQQQRRGAFRRFKRGLLRRRHRDGAIIEEPVLVDDAGNMISSGEQVVTQVPVDVSPVVESSAPFVGTNEIIEENNNGGVIVPSTGEFVTASGAVAEPTESVFVNNTNGGVACAGCPGETVRNEVKDGVHISETVSHVAVPEAPLANAALTPSASVASMHAPLTEMLCIPLNETTARYLHKRARVLRNVRTRYGKRATAVFGRYLCYPPEAEHPENISLQDVGTIPSVVEQPVTEAAATPAVVAPLVAPEVAVATSTVTEQPAVTILPGPDVLVHPEATAAEIANAAATATAIAASPSGANVGAVTTTGEKIADEILVADSAAVPGDKEITIPVGLNAQNVEIVQKVEVPAGSDVSVNEVVGGTSDTVTVTTPSGNSQTFTVAKPASEVATEAAQPSLAENIVNSINSAFSLFPNTPTALHKPGTITYVNGVPCTPPCTVEQVPVGEAAARGLRRSLKRVVRRRIPQRR